MSKILLIEDESDIRELYKSLLEEAGYEVSGASDGEMGLNFALEQDWDLLLLDIMLPKKDGLEVLTNIKSNENLKDRPIVLLSNLEKDTILQTCMNLGANSYLIKSNITPPQVIAEVDKLLGNVQN